MKSQGLFQRFFGQRTNVFETITVAHRFVKFFGYMCFSYDDDWPKSRVKLTFLDILLCIVNVSINSYLFYAMLMDEDEETISIIFNFGIRFILSALTIIGLISSLLNVILSRWIFEILKCFREFDSQIESVGGIIHHHKQFLVINVSAIIVPGLIFVVLMADVFEGNMTIIKFLGLISPVMSFVVTKGTFIFFLVSLRTRFEILNRCFKENFCPETKAIKMVKSIELKGSDPSLLVTKFATLHDYISDATELTSLCFSFQAMIFTGLCFVYNVFIIFSAFRVWTNFNEEFFGLVIGNFHWSFITYGFVLGEIYVAHNVTKLGKYTAILAHKAINRTKDESSIDKLRQMANQINHRPPVITCGLFLFDWTLFYSLCGASTTYLVILIQFDTSIAPVSNELGSLNATLPSFII
ncbi:putative gustatory receptor 28b [Lutzomyia longipalpis]|uniref:putative gustatory receptor 28b n=1 Tax=Lutzomyia longipalpis TaxID=7200 RepID=UPI0024834525|nr:putative gustatory receptor 28b [Lutzomyia longipalpis]XP_055694892.1 putative gustatory receptor 28b [Lutzomyia longipalpis]XP_055694893.1 putative gustatory receptor 28b [Lutzomyia longipalpis]XP_055694894.1 putative gustatory receptor 28b [Lutzomyia longipalpis]XP_055694895.1 putative gustatory receptor 28b [Lutzomyia longipalpis]XP_055694897.1 putative gustatory receptor 28b [Lutzomyia longipalpis]